MEFSRRDTLALGLGAVALSAMPMRASASRDTVIELDAVIAAYTGGAEMGDGDMTLTAPEIAENGNTVPIAVEAPGAVSIMLVAPENPTARVGTFIFGPLAARQAAKTRIRLAGTQDLMAIARMQDGTFIRTTRTVKVTIGGCGG
jgi:sulfur-oxidizing protein SoxY